MEQVPWDRDLKQDGAAAPAGGRTPNNPPRTMAVADVVEDAVVEWAVVQDAVAEAWDGGAVEIGRQAGCLRYRWNRTKTLPISK